jgi:hypothetical protein
VPQQDVFQRSNSSKNESVAVWGTVIGGLAYFLFAAVPLFLAYSATLIDPAMVTKYLAEDAQQILPNLVKGRLPLIAQVIFYGALLSVIMSTASGTPAGAFGDDFREHHQGIPAAPSPVGKEPAQAHPLRRRRVCCAGHTLRFVGAAA